MSTVLPGGQNNTGQIVYPAVITSRIVYQALHGVAILPDLREALHLSQSCIRRAAFGNINEVKDPWEVVALAGGSF